MADRGLIDQPTARTVDRLILALILSALAAAAAVVLVLAQVDTADTAPERRPSTERVEPAEP